MHDNVILFPQKENVSKKVPTVSMMPPEAYVIEKVIIDSSKFSIIHGNERSMVMPKDTTSESSYIKSITTQIDDYLSCVSPSIDDCLVCASASVSLMDIMKYLIYFNHLILLKKDANIHNFSKKDILISKRSDAASSDIIKALFIRRYLILKKRAYQGYYNFLYGNAMASMVRSLYSHIYLFEDEILRIHKKEYEKLIFSLELVDLRLNIIGYRDKVWFDFRLVDDPEAHIYYLYNKAGRSLTRIGYERTAIVTVDTLEWFLEHRYNKT